MKSTRDFKQLGVTIVVFLTMCISWQFASAQAGPPREFGGPLFFSFPLLTNYPPYSTGMPFNVLVGYVGYDSIARRADRDLFERAVQNLTYSDTARYAAKYLYEVVDYDPVRFFQWAYTSPQAGMYKNAPASTRKKIGLRLSQIAPGNLNVIPLLMSDIIAHVKVTQTVASVDTTASLARSAQLVTSYILDTIKGHRIPNCVNEQFKSDKSRAQSIQIAQESCLQFDYRLEWRRLNHTATFSRNDSTLADGQGNPWIKTNQEYIVFLSFVNLHRDDTYNYATLIPVVGWGSTVCMYPIVNGHVYDPYNDFGYGTNLTVDQFKTALRNNISMIIHP